MHLDIAFTLQLLLFLCSQHQIHCCCCQTFRMSDFTVYMQIDLVQGMMDCLYAECTPCITDCVLAELEKLGQKYRVALKVAKVSQIVLRDFPNSPFCGFLRSLLFYLPGCSFDRVITDASVSLQSCIPLLRSALCMLLMHMYSKDNLYLPCITCCAGPTHSEIAVHTQRHICR